MRNLKRKIGVSVLAIACLGASAFGVQSALAASAEETVTIAEGLSMEHGASVSLNEEFSGIRWKTNVVASECSAASEIGVLVAPNVAAADLTVDTAGVKKLKADLDLTQDQTFYTVIDYNEIADNYTGTLTTEEALKKAYALELTARPYMVVNGEYQYADMTGINTARSARQVAIAAELAGEIDEKYRNVEEKAYLADNAEAYYGMTDKYTPGVLSTGAVGTTVINLETIKTANQNIKDIPLDLNGETVEEILVGAERVQGINAYDDSAKTLAFRVLQGQIMPTGEEYVTVFTEEGGLYTAPIICATKVFDEIADFDDFRYIRKNATATGVSSKTGDTIFKVNEEVQEKDPNGEAIDASKLVHDGYYVLGKDLTAPSTAEGYMCGYDYEFVNPTYNAETTGSLEKVGVSGWAGITKFKDKKLGLTGTFNGLGYTIEDLRVRSDASGLFELINGGTVKNLSLVDVKAAKGYAQVGGLAYYAIDPKIENVYFNNTTTYYLEDSHCAFFFYLHQTEAQAMQIRNVYVQQSYNAGQTNKSGTGGLFGVIHAQSNKDISWNNVYVISPAGLSTTLTIKSGAVTKVSRYAYSENQKTACGWSGAALPDGIEPETEYTCKGAYAYYTPLDYGTAVNGDLSAFINDPSGCWTSKTKTYSYTDAEGVAQTYEYTYPIFK